MKKYITIVALAALALSGCSKDFLEEAPKQAQSDVLTLSTFDGLDAATAGAYGLLASTNWYGADFILSNEMQTMNGKRWTNLSQYISGRYTDEYAVHYTQTNTKPLWGTAYYMILSVNSVLEHLDDAGIEATDQQKKNLKAECLFLRALAHFDLVRTYAQPYNNTLTVESAKLGVPVVLTVDAEAKPKRATLVDTFDQIEQDLLDAEAAIDPAYVRDGGNNDASKVSIYAIQALLSRVYLYMENWQKAADYATKVIDSGKFKMWTAAQVTDGDKCVWREDTRKEGEVIFEVWTNQTQTYGTGNENVWAMTTYLGYGDCGASADLLDLYEAGDARKTLVQPDPDGNGLFTKKYFGKGVGSIDANNIIILRLSEMYLNRAEALLHPGVTVTGASAATDLATIASNRGATTLDPTLANVYKEQAKEFAWEAHLWFDLARTGRPMTRTDVSGTSIPTDIQPGDYRWAMPIANRELTVNPNLIQNDGYNN